MKKLSLSLILIVFFQTLLFADSSAINQDKDGCWNASSWCVKGSSKWKGNSFVSYYKNVCSDRVYIKFCNKRKNKRSDCGADGIRPGKTKSWRTSSSPTGNYEWIFIGSTKPASDWVCSGKVSNWRSVN